MSEYEKAGDAADELTKVVREYVKASSPAEVSCPRERTWMTPCVSRDGQTAVADDFRCVGCSADPIQLLAEFRARRGVR